MNKISYTFLEVWTPRRLNFMKINAKAKIEALKCEWRHVIGFGGDKKKTYRH